jgi:hypothetical protein
MLSADSYYAIGKSHRTCQDYTEHYSDDRWAVARLSDGCSSAKDSDWGARLLLRAAQYHGHMVPTYRVAEMAAYMATVVGIGRESLNATLLQASVRRLHLLATVAGDGVVIAQRRGGGFDVCVIEYPSGAPFYPRHCLCGERTDPETVYKRYLATFGRTYQIRRWTWAGGTASLCGGSVEERKLPDDPSCHANVFEFSRIEYDLLIIMSDGIHSFTRPMISETGRTTIPIPLADLFAEFLAFKSFKGDFVARRCAAAFKAINGYGWSHHDDFSMAAVYASEVEG